MSYIERDEFSFQKKGKCLKLDKNVRKAGELKNIIRKRKCRCSCIVLCVVNKLLKLAQSFNTNVINNLNHMTSLLSGG